MYRMRGGSPPIPMCYNAPMKYILALPLILLFAGWQQPVPTHSIYITGEPGAVVQLSASDEQPTGTVTQSEWRLRMPGHFSVNAGHHIKLKIETETPIQAQLFYEYRDTKEWLGSAEGVKDVPITFDIPARD